MATIAKVDERIIVCEGKCNPDIREYDDQVVEFGAARSNREFLMEWARRLVHTKHTRVSGDHWGIGQGWIRKFQCGVCGHVRHF